MEGAAKRAGPGSEDTKSIEPRKARVTTELTVVEAIAEIAKYNANASLNSEYQLALFLRSWWSKTYNRPLKDPLLLSYTLEELLYEFYDKIERERATMDGVEQEADKIEETKVKSNLDWAEQEEQRELEELRRKQADEAIAKKATDSAIGGDPAEDQGNKAWMEEQLKKELEQGKKLFGDNFGEDIEESFDGGR